MSLPFYRGLADGLQPMPADKSRMHMGLWFERYFDGYADGFGAVDKSRRSSWLREFRIAQLGDADALRIKAAKIQQLARALGGQTRVYRCEGNFVTGLGNPHPLENGFLWHPTLGVPYLPGGAAKALVRALIEIAYHGEDKPAVLKRWFGTETKNPDEVAEASGSFIFFDALPLERCELLPEVMTPHMGKWYEQGGNKPLDADTQPGDWHSPVPVAYLVARKLTFQFAIAPRAGALAADVQANELAEVWNALDKALEWLGAGAKTAIGFGRMESEEGKQRKRVEAAEQWDGAQIKFNRANGALTAERRSGDTAVAREAKAVELLDSLPPDVRKKILANQFVRLTAFVERYNLVRISCP